MVEKRGYPRFRVFKGAKVDYARGVYIPCHVRDLSADGGRLRLASGQTLPAKINLEIPSARFKGSARVCWQYNREVGVEFIGLAQIKDCVPPAEAPEDW
jgi:hypothetical protein